MERTLLLVDDDAAIGAAIKRLLRQEGYKILSAHSGQEGLEILARNEVHVILSDQRMPEMTGVEFLSRVKDLYPKTVRLILSGYADLSSVTDAINQGAIYKFLTKPWDNETLCDNVLEAFRHYEQTQQKNYLALGVQEANTTLASLSLDLSKLLAVKDEQIAHISSHDPLTNLPNRSLFIEKINQAITQAQIKVQQAAILLIDLDRFNVINDTFGYVAGDKLLQAVSAHLAKFASVNDTLARIGDNEFGLLLTNIKKDEEAGATVQQIQDLFDQLPVAIGDNETMISLSIGISIYPSNGPDTNSMLKTAGAALRLVKNRKSHF
jgi:diguanylate cyclase (GGDEF)-like protein